MDFLVYLGNVCYDFRFGTFQYDTEVDRKLKML